MTKKNYSKAYLDTHTTYLEEKDGLLFYGEERADGCVLIICFSKQFNSVVYEQLLTPFNMDMARLGQKFLDITK